MFSRINPIGKLIAFILIILFIPLYLFAMIGILISMGRPIFYNKKRLGKDKKLFTCYKFRTMTIGKRVRNDSNPVGKEEDDIRITKFGKFLRSLSIDEIPQLFNILKGDMNIIGVRPCEEDEVEFLPEERFLHKPGLSGAVDRWRGIELSKEEVYNQEKEFSINYDFKAKCKALKSGFKAIWRNK